jgi:hypothetical protein
VQNLVRVVGFSLVVGCSSSSGSGGSAGGLDCSWLGKSDNCFKTTVAAAASCLPADGDSGTFSADNLTCVYSNGTTVHFAQPLALPLPDDPQFNFTVTSASGASCLTYEDTGDGFHLTTSAGVFTEGTSGLGVTLTCPDGKSVSSANGLELLSCDGGFFGGVPGKSWSSSMISASLSLIGTSSNGSTVLFNCKKP